MLYGLAPRPRAEAIGRRLPGRADGYPSGPPTDPYVRNSRIRFLKQSFCCPWMQSNGGLVTRLVSTESLSCVCSLHALPDVAFPPVGRLGLTSPLSSVQCAATTATSPSQGASLVARLPDTLPASRVRGVPHGLVTRGKPPGHARAFGHPVPHSGYGTRRQVALPRSRVPPVKTCPALRPRWCPAYSPYRTQDCCLPALAHRRLSPPYLVRDILLSTTIHISGLNHAACLLALPGSVRPLTGRHAGSLLTGWLGFDQVGLEP